MNSQVRVTRLEELLHAARQALPRIIKWYWNLLDNKTGPGDRPKEPSPEILTQQDFLEALRLNPDRNFFYVRALRPDELSRKTPHDPSREGPPGGVYVETRPGEQIRALDVLCAFADEPDWGMDQDLFTIEKYGYGLPPFAAGTGHTSQAPFHMAFLHERAVIRRLFPRIATGFMEERVEVFLALAEMAFRLRNDYWGWRFAAWVMHYLQDLTAPYHAKCFPPSITAVLTRFLRDPNPFGFVKRNHNLLINRHRLFEAVVHFLLNDAVKTRRDTPFIIALTGHGEGIASNVRTVMEESARIAARVAPRLDRLAIKLVNDPRIEDPGFDFQEDHEYEIEKAMHPAVKQRPRIFQEFTNNLCKPLSRAGIVTRYVLGKIQESGSGVDVSGRGRHT